MNTGGSAFPAQPIFRYPDGTEIGTVQGGMTLRDYFAAAALKGMLIQGMTEETGVAHFAYLYADAMLKTREAT